MERFSRGLHTTPDIIGMDLQILKVALPYPSIPSSIKEYYGLRNKVVRFLTSKESMMKDFLLKAGWDLPILKNLSVGRKSSTPDALQKLDCRCGGDFSLLLLRNGAFGEKEIINCRFYKIARTRTPFGKTCDRNI